MKEMSDERRTEESTPTGRSRRDFIVSAATAVAGAGAAQNFSFTVFTRRVMAKAEQGGSFVVK